MPKYRRRHIEVNAEQFDGTRECADRLINLHKGDVWRVSSLSVNDPKILKMRVENGISNLFQGDWIIETEDGEIHICRSYDFDKAYKLMEE